MNGWESKLNPYLHQPAQVAWFTLEEWYLIGTAYAGAVVLSPWVYLTMLVLILFVFPAVRKKERAYFKHLMVAFGVAELNGYPPVIATRFSE